jgi:hypothetical protein
MGEHARLSAMVGFVSQHVAQHFGASRPRFAPAVSVKLLDAATAAERFRQHLGAASGALGLPQIVEVDFDTAEWEGMCRFVIESLDRHIELITSDENGGRRPRNLRIARSDEHGDSLALRPEKLGGFVVALCDQFRKLFLGTLNTF